MIGLMTERDGYEAVAVPPGPDDPAGGGAPGSGRAMLRRRSALPSRRCVLWLHWRRDAFAPEDLVSWYTQRGFHFYVADLRRRDGADFPARRRQAPSRGECLARLDTARRHLRDAEGIETLVVSAHAADALTAALWCAAGRDAGVADALILSSPAFGRRLRRSLDIACPVLVMSPASSERRDGRMRRGNGAQPSRLGSHVTWLRLEHGLDGQACAEGSDRRRVFDEIGRWLGAYMYGGVRDQLL